MNMIPLVMANEPGTAHRVTAGHLGLVECRLARLKSGETLMEDRSDSDVQIDRRSWVYPTDGLKSR